MGAIRDIEWEPCLLEPTPCPDLEQHFRKETGRPGHLMRFFESCPWLADTIIRLSVQHKTHVHVDPNLADQMGLVISQDNSCRFCFGMQRAYLRTLGMSEARIARMEQDQLTGDFEPRERAALDFARRVSHGRPLASAADAQALRDAGFTRIEIAELAGMTASHLFFNRLATLAALPPEPMEQFPDHWWMRFVRPLVALRFRRMRRHEPETKLSEAEKAGPGAAIVNALDGLPVAHELRAILDAMWNSSPLPARTVSLTFAVVSRALGAVHCEREARSMLHNDGIGDADIDRILDHLASPVLSPAETVLVPFARETVWYQPARIQRRSADVRQRLDKAEFLHFLGIVSLVNAICRIGFIADVDG